MTLLSIRAPLFLLAIVVFTAHTRAVTYTATILSQPFTANTAKAYGASIGSQAGYTTTGLDDSDPHALLWNDSPTGFVDLHPTEGYQWSRAYAVSGNTQVGEGHRNGPGQWHALLWNGTAESKVELEPSGFSESSALGVSGGTQVGWAGKIVSGSSQHHALIWNGAATSFVDLHPAGYAASEAWAVSGGTQVGYATQGGQHAMLWNGTALSYVDLHPAAWSTSFATGVSDNTQVGFVYGGNATPQHAALWKGSAASFVDLNPAGFSNTFASATAGGIQVGSGRGTATGSDEHALLWNGTAASVVDLHQFLSGFDVNLSSSIAKGVAADGTIVGYGRGPFIWYPIMWTPVPDSGNPGDYNNNGAVDAADYALWRSGSNSLSNEVATPGSNTPEDYAAWRERFGNIVGSSTANNAAVPEPTAWALFAWGLAATSIMFARRRL